MQQTPFTPLGQTTPAFPGTYPRDPSAVLPGFHRPFCCTLANNTGVCNNIFVFKTSVKVAAFLQEKLCISKWGSKREQQNSFGTPICSSDLLSSLWAMIFVGECETSLLHLSCCLVQGNRENWLKRTAMTEITGIRLNWTTAASTRIPGGTTLDNSFSLHPEKHFLSLPSTLFVSLAHHDYPLCFFSPFFFTCLYYCLGSVWFYAAMTKKKTIKKGHGLHGKNDIFKAVSSLDNRTYSKSLGYCTFLHKGTKWKVRHYERLDWKYLVTLLHMSYFLWKYKSNINLTKEVNSKTNNRSTYGKYTFKMHF